MRAGVAGASRRAACPRVVGLIVKLAAEIQKHGGVYLKGGVVGNAVVRGLYQKIAMFKPAGESYVSGRAFRRVAELSEKSLREIVKNLPATTWNYDL